MSDTSKATEARVQNAVARREKKALEDRIKTEEQKIQKRYGEFLPENAADPLAIYKLWQRSIFGDAQPDDSIMYFVVAQAKAAGIDARVPRQIYALPFKHNFKDATGKWQSETNYTVIIGIEGLVTIAENTGQYGGSTKPEYEFGVDDNGNVDLNEVISCSIGVHKIVQGVPVTSFQTVYFDEYTTGKNLWRRSDTVKEKKEYKDNIPTGKVTTIPDGGKPKTMLKKVALAHALRATFSACAGLYVAEEMDRENVVEGEVVPPDTRDRIEAAVDYADLQEILGTLDVSEKKKAADLIGKRMTELNK